MKTLAQEKRGKKILLISNQFLYIAFYSGTEAKKEPRNRT
jgi:hypothetical protein